MGVEIVKNTIKGIKLSDWKDIEHILKRFEICIRDIIREDGFPILINYYMEGDHSSKNLSKKNIDNSTFSFIEGKIAMLNIIYIKYNRTKIRR